MSGKYRRLTSTVLAGVLALTGCSAGATPTQSAIPSTTTAPNDNWPSIVLKATGTGPAAGIFYQWQRGTLTPPSVALHDQSLPWTFGYQQGHDPGGPAYPAILPPAEPAATLEVRLDVVGDQAGDPVTCAIYANGSVVVTNTSPHGVPLESTSCQHNFVH